MTERFAGFMYWNRKAVIGQFDGFIMSKPKNCDGRFAGFTSWNRKAVTGKFDGFIMSKPKKLRRAVCLLNVLEQKRCGG